MSWPKWERRTAKSAMVTRPSPSKSPRAGPAANRLPKPDRSRAKSAIVTRPSPVASPGSTPNDHDGAANASPNKPVTLSIASA